MTGAGTGCRVRDLGTEKFNFTLHSSHYKHSERGK